MKRVFVDSGAFFAHLVSEDAGNERIREAFKQVRADAWQLITSNAVVFETHALLVDRARKGWTLAMTFLGAIRVRFLPGRTRHRIRRGPRRRPAARA